MSNVKSSSERSVARLLLDAKDNRYVVSTQTQLDFKVFEIFEQIKNFESQFDDKKIEILFENMSNSYAIDLIKNQQFFFMTLYNLFQKKLTKLRRYLKNVLIKS